MGKRGGPSILHYDDGSSSRNYKRNLSISRFGPKNEKYGQLSSKRLTRIQLSKHVTRIVVRNAAELEKIEVEEGSMLKYAFFPSCNIKNIDISHCSRLKSLSLRTNPTTNLKIPDTLPVLDIRYTNLKAFHVPPSMTTLQCDNIDLSGHIDSCKRVEIITEAEKRKNVW